LTESTWTSPLALAVLGDEEEPAVDPRADRLAVDSLPVEDDAPDRVVPFAEQALQQLRPARTHQPVDADDLAGRN